MRDVHFRSTVTSWWPEVGSTSPPVGDAPGAVPGLRRSAIVRRRRFDPFEVIVDDASRMAVVVAVSDESDASAAARGRR
jgi:hypothetical protein